MTVTLWSFVPGWGWWCGVGEGSIVTLVGLCGPHWSAVSVRCQTSSARRNRSVSSCRCSCPHTAPAAAAEGRRSRHCERETGPDDCARAVHSHTSCCTAPTRSTPSRGSPPVQPLILKKMKEFKKKRERELDNKEMRSNWKRERIENKEMRSNWKRELKTNKKERRIGIEGKKKKEKREQKDKNFKKSERKEEKWKEADKTNEQKEEQKDGVKKEKEKNEQIKESWENGMEKIKHVDAEIYWLNLDEFSGLVFLLMLLSLEHTVCSVRAVCGDLGKLRLSKCATWLATPSLGGTFHLPQVCMVILLFDSDSHRRIRRIGTGFFSCIFGRTEWLGILWLRCQGSLVGRGACSLQYLRSGRLSRFVNVRCVEFMMEAQFCWRFSKVFVLPREKIFLVFERGNGKSRLFVPRSVGQVRLDAA